MLDSLICDRAKRLIEVDFDKRRKLLPADIGHLKADAARRGMLSSGNTIMSLYNIFARELEIRSVIVWQNIVRAHQNNGAQIADSLRADLKQEVNKYILQAFDELTFSLQRELQNPGLPNVPPQSTLVDAKNHEIAKHDIEIDLYVDSLEKNAPTKAPSQNYNFYGNIGAVQTGANAIAHVFQNLSEGDKSAINTAIQQSRTAIENSTELDANQKREIIEIANECAVQINSEQPNNTKLLTLLTILGTTVQSIASAPTAYNALKTALLPLGITLP